MISTLRAASMILRTNNPSFCRSNVRFVSTNTPKTSSVIWKLATFATVGTTFAVVGNYLNDKSWRYEETTAGPVAPLAQVTSAAYFDVSIDNKPAGRIVLGLYGDVVPKTVANFEKYCHKGYQGTLFHRIIPGFMIQGGQIVPTSGSMTFDDENFILEHVGPGVLSMANAGRNTNTTQFFITTARTPHLNGRHVVFGSVQEGWDVVKAIEACGTSSGNPSGIVRITAAGVLPVERQQN